MNPAFAWHWHGAAKAAGGHRHMTILSDLKTTAKSAIRFHTLPSAAKKAHRADRAGLPAGDPGIAAVTEACTQWLYRAQDQSSSHDGGIASHFSLIDGWGESYPETSGYIVPTFLTLSRSGGDEAEQRARKVLDWFLGIQLPDGGFRGSTVNALPRVPVTFNTGQILLGLSAGAARFGNPYLAPMHKSAAWLRDTMDGDGAWRRHPTPFAAPGEKAYETHVAWGW
ncbi:hypothetical protein HK414_09880 [Ramlibacter terrae]|uniref:Squalene cyclase C-terminal domain-containing protein n=1 Tax=Ramlibacter terrae TaxID=2732511 RepID=A0ABX6P3C9_9BURK|nr:hypothetical protein HK414_09880 [Ramlibacter terrae]